MEATTVSWGAHEMISPDDELLTIQMYDSLSYFFVIVNYTGGKFSMGWKKLVSILLIYFFFLKPIDKTLISVKLIEKR